jgi:hypothetical protein
VPPATTARPGTRLYHLGLAVLPAAGLVIQLLLIVLGGTDVSSGDSGAAVPLGTRLVRLFSYFTIQSNVLVLVVALLLALRPDRDGPVWRVLRLDSLLGIVITGIVFATVLAPLVSPEGAAWVANILLHHLTPWLFLLGWVLFGPRPRITWGTVAGAFVWPLAWIAWTLLHGALTGWYPYPFLDAGELGYPVALRNTVAVLLLAAVLGVALRLLDRLPSLR